MARKHAGGGDQVIVEQQGLQQEVQRHYVKTIYFNNMWKSFLGKMAFFVSLVSAVMLYRMHHSAFGLQFEAIFEVLSALIAACTALFVQRSFKPLLMFKVSFVLALLQSAWILNSLYSRVMGFPRHNGDLLADQLPFGAIYFVICWIADRFMMRSISVAEQNASEINDVSAGASKKDL